MPLHDVSRGIAEKLPRGTALNPTMSTQRPYVERGDIQLSVPGAPCDTQHAHAQKRVIAVVASLTISLTNFRLELLKKLVKAGHEVVAFAPENDERVEQQLAQIGVTFVRIPMARTGLNPLDDLRTLLSLRGHFKRLKPDVVLPYTMKPIIYAGIAARMLGIKDRCFLVTGLGHVFSNETPASLKSSLVRHLCVRLYRIAFRSAKAVFVYNEADRADICKYQMLDSTSVLSLIPGSGVDLEHFAFSPPPQRGPVFLLVARLLRDKGIVEYVEAARIVRRSFPDAKFQLLGSFDSNPTAISRDEIDGWVREGILEYLGYTQDVRPYLAGCSVFVLPSYYREGIPRSILEALATGRPIVTTDLPGCRDTVQPGVNGLVVQPRDPLSLAEAMSVFARNARLAAEMGRQSRYIAQARFDVHMVNQMLLDRMHLA
nr:glycosyltransferase family 4 protein [Ensifer sp. IC4062]